MMIWLYYPRCDIQTNPSPNKPTTSGIKRICWKGRSNVWPKLPHELLRWWSLPRSNLTFGKLGSNWPAIFSPLCVRDQIWQNPAPGTGTSPFLSIRFTRWSFFSSNEWGFYEISHCQVCLQKHSHSLFNRHSPAHCTLLSAPWCKILELIHSGPGMAGNQRWGLCVWRGSSGDTLSSNETT